MIIALASPRIAPTLDEGLEKLKWLLAEAAAQGAQIVCFPEAYLPGLRGLDFDVPPFDRVQQEQVLAAAARWTQAYGVAAIIGMEWITARGRQIASVVFDAHGQIRGMQAKTQLDPSEDWYYVPGEKRQLFEVDGVKFGVSICHEGWRYPETVRWAAVRGAKLVFHPQHTGSDRSGIVLTHWGAVDGPYYEKAMMMRSLENTIYFASVNYAMRFQESATSLIDPVGQCQAYLPTARRGCSCRRLTSSRPQGYWPVAMRRSGTKLLFLKQAHSLY